MVLPPTYCALDTWVWFVGFFYNDAYLVVQIEKTDAPLKAPYNEQLPIDLFSGQQSFAKVQQAFQVAGLTYR